MKYWGRKMSELGDYAKVQVVSYGYDLELKFETYRAG